MDLDDDESGGFRPTSMVSLTPFASSVSPSPRRLSSCFAPPNEPVRAKRQLAWVSLQGRLVGADEASAAKTVDRHGVFSTEEAVAWDLFSPIQRVLTVAVVAASAADSRKNKQILKLQESVQLRDQVLLSMQKKLDNLCEQVNYFKDQTESETQSDVLITTECGSKLCHQNLPPNCSSFNTPVKGSIEDEVFEYKTPVTVPDERRMSDLSDWAPSITSSIDTPLDGSAVEDEINSLRKECEEKDVTIKELSDFLKSSQILGSKRIAELEDIIRRKNMIINKLRKDMIVLEQKVVSLTRQRRPSFQTARSNLQHVPKMADNVLYDMEATTGPSSSDSDTPPKNRKQTLGYGQIGERDSNRGLTCLAKTSEKKVSVRATVALIEKSLNQEAASKSKYTMHGGGENRSSRRPPSKSKDVAGHKRWL